MKLLRLFLILVVLAIALGLQVIPAQAYSVSGWTRIYEGVEYATGYVTSPRTMRAFAARISLRNPDVAMYASHNNGTAPYEVTLQTTPAFLSEHGCKVAVNACFFDAGLSPNSDIWGLLVSNGSVVSTPNASPFNSYVSFSATKAPTFGAGGSVPAGAYNSVGGAEILLSNGVNLGGAVDPQPATWIGLSQDQNYMIIVCVDGRQPGWSDGATTWDMGQWMLDFGGYNAIKFDGGGSTTLTRADVGDVNKPCYGYDRPVGASLGVKSVASGAIGPDVVSWDSSRIDVVTRGADNGIGHKHLDGTTWSDWLSLGGDTRYSPAIASWGTGRLDVFYTGTDNNLHHRYWSNNVWSPSWTNKGGNLTSAPAAVSWGPDRIDVVARGSDQHTIWHIWWDGSAWSGWESLGGDATSDPAICSWGVGRLDVLYKASDNSLHHRYYTGGAWSPSWTSKGGNLSSAPAAVSWGPNRIDVFARGSDQHTIWHIYWNGSDWIGWNSEGGDAASAPAVCSRGANKMDVFYRSPSDQLMVNDFSSNQWTGWHSDGYYY